MSQCVERPTSPSCPSGRCVVSQRQRDDASPKDNRRDGHGLPGRDNEDGGGNPLHRDTEETVQADADDVEIGKEQGMKDRREELFDLIMEEVRKMNLEELQMLWDFIQTL